MNLPPVYNPQEVESRWYPEWESRGYFKPDPKAPKGPFTIVIPPPNVTGILHMGHALNNTLQDVLIRWKRMQGYQALWVPGTDHAGIATQNVVERQIAKEKLTRQQLGREKFVERVWEWKKSSGATIVKQLRRLGASCDWSRERFTMDEGLSKAVQTAFLELHRQGLLYRGYYLVNWCPRCQTALSDEEVIHEEVKSHLWHILYPFDSAQGERLGVVVATTRPETLLGDVAVAVHPEDDRYRQVSGKNLLLPILRRKIPIIADAMVEREFGTGAVKVTPAHDLNDFLLGQRHKLSAIRVIDAEGRMNALAGPYAGQDRFECRKNIVRDLEAQGLLVKTEAYATSIGHCYRCKTIIEPALSPQWFVRMEPLAKLGIEAVEKDGLRFIPDRWTRVYLDWLRNIRDWCVSRQIWWGHRIPAWYCRNCYPAYVAQRETQALSSGTQMEEKTAGIHVGQKPPASCAKCGGSDFVQDEDVLDTWFSSWLWPFSTLGWPDKTPDLTKFYPTSVLVTGQDIIFFWVARMVMAGKFFLKQIPFKDVYIHGIIRVEGGKKMSKSLGNIIDPLEVIDRLGTDALRFSIAHMTSEGQDLYLSEQKFLLGRNFANKLWNASRLIFGDGETVRPSTSSGRTDTLADRWIMSRLQRTIGEVTKALEEYRFNEMARSLYRFVWNDFCDWYLEVSKLQRNDEILRHVLEVSLRLLHPLMPFITEELWQKVQPVRPELVEGQTIMKTPWPQPDSKRIDEEAERLFGRLQNVVTEVRNIRATFRVPPKEKVDLLVLVSEGGEVLSEHEEIIQRLGQVNRLTVAGRLDRPAGSVVAHLEGSDLIVPLAGLVDLGQERVRIQKEIADLESRMISKRARLDNPAFRGGAPTDVVEEEEKLLRGLEEELRKWAESLKQLQ